ncbi:MAG: aminodeoxychorismate/anthranilate synthase component II [Flavobacterium sp. BFFFF1]|uniref:anthranilate synthase component II n=1 Tax=Flavobacterium sp. BFFFF1 TaxID=2015557 RepID=UPI000BCC96F7|nr:aminodeoxychorismate/anthranilate synthase component II [Flavobacterium sp. BFFFF1]OYU79663.1 MAG: aminodeoxychorismate/anthranilate synthase component II [Flavobacterium sp. BFFFF1]
MKQVLIIDNYDSFTFNLSHYLEDLGASVTIWRNNAFDLDDVERFDKVLLSPGPGIPSEAGQLLEVIRRYASTKSILGICLGQQAIAEVFGGSLVNLKKVHHGVASTIKVIVADEMLFKDMPPEIAVGRYHSWTVNRNLPVDLEVTSVDIDGEIMSLRHRTYDVKAVQFHPESILTPHGKLLLKNWVDS